MIYVLNTTTDDSRTVIEQGFAGNAEVIDLPDRGKPAALRAGDTSAPHTNSVYLDADVIVDKATITALLERLHDGSADLVAPRIVVDLVHSKGQALRVSRVWANQLLRRQDAYMNCTAFSAAGLHRRGPWADVLADDDWARDRIDPMRRKIVETAQGHILPPRDLKSWLAARARWIRGSWQLRQRNETARLVFSRTRPQGTLMDLVVYYAVRFAAEPIAHLHRFRDEGWERDDSTRVKTDG